MLGIVSDAHGNGPALALALDTLRALGATRFAFLGDAVGYIPSVSALAVLKAIAPLSVCLRGNHEQMLLDGGASPERDAVYGLARTRELLSEEAILGIAAWPAAVTETFAAGRALFVHGSPNDPTDGYLYPDADLSAQRTDADFVFCGHTHRPFIRRAGDTLFVNAGSCGLPRDDGRYGAAAIFDTDRGAARIVRFEITASLQHALAESGPLHPSVRELFARRSAVLEGELHVA
jgi:predicted phosphodiesterase